MKDAEQQLDVLSVPRARLAVDDLADGVLAHRET
jgi:hypothetical protein